MFLQLKNLVKHYDATQVLQDINLEIEKGDFLVLLGGSGCGKSTLLNCIAGLDEVTSGQIFINQKEVTHLAPYQRDVAMVFQSYALYPTMTVARNITFALECARTPKAEREKMLKKIATFLQIEHILARKPKQLSGGQQQRVAIGRALVRNPSLFLLDEPMSNLDAKLRNEMRQELRNLHQELQATFVFVTHDQTEAMSMATKIAVLDSGIVQQFGTPHELYQKPANLFIAEFIGFPSMNFIVGEIQINADCPYFVVGNTKISLETYTFLAPPQAGQAVKLGIRPEHIYRTQALLEGAHFIAVDLPILRTEMTGADINVKFELEGQPLTARFSSSKTPQAGTVERLYLELAHCSVFDLTTGKRL